MKTNPTARLVSFRQDAPKSSAAPSTGPVSVAMAQARESRHQQLTARELDVLSLLCEGLSNKVIQRRLGIGAGTVKCHVGSILGKLGVSSRLQAVVAAHRMGLVDGAAAQHGNDAQESASESGLGVWLGRRTDDCRPAAA